MDINVWGVHRTILIIPQDWIFDNGATAFLVAKIGTKRFINIWVVCRATDLKFGIYADYPKYITGTYFGAIVAILDFCF